MVKGLGGTVRCPECGTEAPDIHIFCEYCGCRLEENAPEERLFAVSEPTEELPSRPVSVIKAPRLVQSRDKLTVRGFITSLLVLMLPTVGLVFAIVWACGGSKSRARVCLSRAVLIIGGAAVLLLAAYTALALTAFSGILPLPDPALLAGIIPE